jgi:hypothetical protein
MLVAPAEEVPVDPAGRGARADAAAVRALLAYDLARE